MADLGAARQWRFMLIFMSVMAFSLLWRLLPVDLGAKPQMAPDALLCIIVAWAMRRPEHLPLWFLCAFLLLDDVLLLRPPGLRACIIILAVEFLRTRNVLTRELHYVIEWLLSGAVMLGCFLLEKLLLGAFLLPHPPLASLLWMWLGSVLFYPVPAVLGRVLLKL